MGRKLPAALMATGRQRGVLGKLLLTLAVLPLLHGCGGDAERARQALVAILPEKHDVEFRNVESFDNDVVCGEYRTMDPMRGSSSFEHFIVRGDRADDRPSDQDWDIFCSADQAASFTAHFGIGPTGKANPELQAIRGDIGTLDEALKSYEADNYFLPSSAQGLEALVARSKLPPPPVRFRAGGYLGELPLDPWGRPYLYRRSGLGGVAHDYRIYTLGADGEPGGKGQDADVGSEHMVYLDQIDPLPGPG